MLMTMVLQLNAKSIIKLVNHTLELHQLFVKKLCSVQHSCTYSLLFCNSKTINTYRYGIQASYGNEKNW